MRSEIHEETIEAPPADVVGLHRRSRRAVRVVRRRRVARARRRRGRALPVRRRHRTPRRGRGGRAVPAAALALARASRRRVRQPHRRAVDGHDRARRRPGGTRVRIVEHAGGPRRLPERVGRRRMCRRRCRVRGARRPDATHADGDALPRGPATLAQLSSQLPVSRQAVTKHLATLQEAGLVTGHGEIRGRRYELTPGPLADAMGWMVDVGAGWDDRLARLKRDVEARRR